MQDWRENLDDVLDMAWATMRGHRGTRGGFPGLAVLSTIGEGGGPESRAMVLRRADREAGVIDMYSDSETPKVRQIAAEPRVAVQLWASQQRIQLRLGGRAAVITGPQAQEEWRRVPDHAIVNYGVMPPPGTPIAAPNAYERRPEQGRFAVLRITIETIDLVHLGEPHHIRAAFRRANGWAGHWLAP